MDRPTKALIYCRVSGKKQTTEGSGLDSQEYRCRQYAKAKGYTVEAVFPDDVSGGGDFRIFKIEIKTFAHSTAHLHFAAQLQVEFSVAGIALEIVEYHDEALAGARVHVC